MKSLAMLSLVMVFAFAFAFAGAAHAATYGTMPVLYNSSGDAVNTSGGTLAAGTYYLMSNGTHPVRYSSDGTYYDPATNLYGGSVFNPTGAAGTYTVPGTVPGVPNTGAGGDALATWMTLALSAGAACVGAAYLARSRYVATK